MDQHIVLKTLIDNLCVNMDLKSWTVHENSKGTNCVLRFHERADILNTEVTDDHNVQQQRSVTYKRKSSHQVKRDKSRMDSYIQRKGHLRQDSVETPRLDEDISYNELSKPSLSVDSIQDSESSALNASAMPFHMTEHSNSSVLHSPDSTGSNLLPSSPQPDTSIIAVQTLDTPISPDAQRYISMEEGNGDYIDTAVMSSLNDITETFSDCNAETIAVNNPRLGNYFDLLNNSYASNNSTSTINPDTSNYSSDTLCNLCNAIAPFKTSMLYCERCDYHICGSCVISFPNNSHSVNCIEKLSYVCPKSRNSEPPDKNFQQEDDLMKPDVDLTQSLDCILSKCNQSFKQDFMSSIKQDIMSSISEILYEL